MVYAPIQYLRSIFVQLNAFNYICAVLKEQYIVNKGCLVILSCYEIRTIS